MTYRRCQAGLAGAVEDSVLPGILSSSLGELPSVNLARAY